MSFNASDYWNARLDESFTLQGVGYRTFSAGYNDWLYRRKRVVLRSLLQTHTPDLTGARVLDIGCGTGFFVRQYLERGARVTGLDITARSVRELSERYPEARFVQQDVGSPAGALDEQFDLINMWDVMYHIVDERAFGLACDNIAAMTKTGGCFLVSDMFGAAGPVSPAEHVVFRGRPQYEAALGRHGFELKQVVPLYRFLNRSFRWSNEVTNRLAPFLYVLDNHNGRVMARNLSVGVWRKAR